MERRKDEFITEVRSVKLQAIAPKDLSKWLNDWAAYIVTGTDRPPKPPKVP